MSCISANENVELLLKQNVLTFQARTQWKPVNVPITWSALYFQSAHYGLSARAHTHTHTLTCFMNAMRYGANRPYYPHGRKLRRLAHKRWIHSIYTHIHSVNSIYAFINEGGFIIIFFRCVVFYTLNFHSVFVLVLATALRLALACAMGLDLFIIKSSHRLWPCVCECIWAIKQLERQWTDAVCVDVYRMCVAMRTRAILQCMCSVQTHTHSCH